MTARPTDARRAEPVTYGGWENCLRLANAEIELIATTDVGPRVIRFGFIDGTNEFVEYPEQLGVKGGSVYRGYGGHRLWVAPEIGGWTNHPDNERVAWLMQEEELILQPPIEQHSRLQKEIRIWLDPRHNHVRVTHRVTNRQKGPQTLAAWALSVMAPDGCAIIPHEPYQPHAERVLPVRPLALWGYTEMQDPRWTWGNRYVQLRQDRSAKSVQKIGAMITQGWAAYANGSRLFIKTFPFDAKCAYPDFGCNAEFFTNSKMLEVESLGPLVTLNEGESTQHVEHWHLFRGVTIGVTDTEIEFALAPLLAQIHE